MIYEEDFDVFEKWESINFKSSVTLEGDMLFTVYAIFLEAVSRGDVGIDVIYEVEVDGLSFGDDVVITYRDLVGKEFVANCYHGLYNDVPVLMLASN